MNRDSQSDISLSATSMNIGTHTADRHFASHSTPSSMWPNFLTGQPGQPVRVLLIDDDPHMRLVIAQELLADLRINLIGQAGSKKEGRRLMVNEFDVMLVDLNLGDGTGFELIEHMKTVRPMAEAIVISAMEDEQHALKAFEMGATGYLIKNSWFGNFPQAVLQVVNGGASITPSLARRLLGKFNQAAVNDARHYNGNGNGGFNNLGNGANNGASNGIGNGNGTGKGTLSEREKEVLKLVASGYTSAEIGVRLGISCQTVNTHIKNIYRKLQVRTRAQAVSYAAHLQLFL